MPRRSAVTTGQHSPLPASPPKAVRARLSTSKLMFRNSSHFVVQDGTFNEVHGDLNLNQTSRGLSGLQILQQAIVGGAIHDSSERFPPPKCHPQTRRQIIPLILNWIRDSSRRTRILWLNGPAGAGKSSIAQTIAEKCAGSSCLAASFFFSRASPGRSSAELIFATIAYQLAFAFPSLKRIIGEVVEGDPSILTKSMDIQFSQLILKPMRLVEQVSSESKVIIIDGLDECEDQDIQAYITQLIGRACNRWLPVCFFIASRPEPHIQDAFNVPAIRHLCRRLILDKSFCPDEDIHVFLRASFSEIQHKHRRIMQSAPTPWPSDSDMSTLVARSSGQFIYAATVVKFVDERGHRPTDRLRIVLDMSPPAKASSAFVKLDSLYSQILSCSANIPLTLHVLAALVVIPSHFPCGVVFLEDLLLLQSGDVYLALSSLHSLLSVPDPKQLHANVTSYHKSFFDFLIDSQRSTVFSIDINVSHTSLARCCLHILADALKEKDQTDTKGILPDTVDYSYRHWCFHCRQADPDPELLGDLQRLDIVGLQLDNPEIFFGYSVSFLGDFRGVIEWLTGNSSFKAQAVYQAWSRSLDGYFTQCLDRCTHPKQISFMLGLWLLDLPRPSFSSLRALSILWDSSLPHLQHVFFSSQIFLEFLKDPLRSGKFNPNPVVYACITLRLLEFIDSDPLYFTDPILLDASKKWSSSLTQSAPTPELLSMLRSVPVTWPTGTMYLLTRGNNLQVVLDWLEKISPPPLDVIERWRDLGPMSAHIDHGPIIDSGELLERNRSLQRFLLFNKVGFHGHVVGDWSSFARYRATSVPWLSSGSLLSRRRAA